MRAYVKKKKFRKIAKYIISQTLNTKEIPENIEKKFFAEIFCEKKNFREKNSIKKIVTKKKVCRKKFSPKKNL